MRILRIVPSISRRTGGPAEGIIRITPHLERFGIHTDILTLDDSNKRPQSDPFLCNLRIFRVGSSKYPFRISPRLFRYLNENSSVYDLIVIHGLWNPLSVIVLSRLSRTPYVVIAHGMLDSYFAKNYPLRHLKKLLYWLLFERRLLTKSLSVLFTTQRELQASSSTFPFSNFSKSLLPYGTDRIPKPIKSRERFYSSLGIPSHRRIILYVGRIHPKKGLHILLNAFKQLLSHTEDYQLLIAGPNEHTYAQMLQSAFPSEDFRGHLTWSGMLTSDSKSQAFSYSEVFCIPSFQENFAISVAEALSVGLPVLTSRYIYISDRIDESAAGICFDPNPTDLFNTLLDWSKYDHHTKLAFSHNAQRLFE